MPPTRILAAGSRWTGSLVIPTGRSPVSGAMLKFWLKTLSGSYSAFNCRNRYSDGSGNADVR